MSILARIDVVSRRNSRGKDILVYGDIILNDKEHTVTQNGEEVLIDADETLFKSLLYNLIDNARKACVAGGEVTVSIQKQNDKAVSDLSRGYSRKRTHSEREGLKPLLVAIKH